MSNYHVYGQVFPAIEMFVHSTKTEKSSCIAYGEFFHNFQLRKFIWIFCSADEIPIVRCEGYKLTKELLTENGFDVPILIEKKDGLDLIVPPPSFTIQDVENHVGKFNTQSNQMMMVKKI